MTGCSLEADPGLFYPQVMMGQRDLNIFNLYGEAKFTGAVDTPLFPTNGIPLLVYAIGTDAVTGASAPYTHTVTQANLLPSLTIEKNIGGYQSQQFAGCRINKYTLKMGTGNTEAACSIDVAGQSVAVLDTPTSETYVNESPFVFAEATLDVFGNNTTQASNISMDIENGLKETYTYWSQHGPGFVTPLTRHITGTFDVVFSSLDDATWGFFDKMENGTLGALDFSLTHPGNGGSVAINLNKIALSKYSNALRMTDVVMTTLTFEAQLDLTASPANTITAVIQNGAQTAY